MATDFLLLQHYPDPARARFRHYDWRAPAFTFGYSQQIGWVRGQLPADESIALCRRPSGGGLVDHRDDWTYALVIPRGHTLYDARAIESYEAVHRTLANCLDHLGCDATVKDRCDPCEDGQSTTTGICFRRAEQFDVVHAKTGAKIAGAAQKRAKRGLLLQGSIWKPAADEVDWDSFAQEFPQALANLLHAEIDFPGWPETWDDAIDPLAESYGSPEWNERR